MKDWVFYPLIIIFCGALIAIALSFGRSDKIDTSQGLIVQGQDLSRLVVAPGHTLDMSGNTTPIFATIRSHAMHKDAPSAGVFLALPQDYQDDYAGREVTFSIRVKQTRRNSTTTFRTGFFSPGGSTGWKEFSATSEFQEFTFSYRPTQIADGNDYFYFGVWADWTGQGDGIDVSNLSVKPVSSAMN